MGRKKKTQEAGAGKKRIRRSSDQIILALQAKIQEVKNRAAAQNLKQSPSIRRTLTLIRALDKTLSIAEQEGNNQVRHALAEARKPMAEFLTGQGLRLPKPRMPRGRKPKM
jgi:hypothetical protein